MSNPFLLLAQARAADSIFNNMGSSLRDRNGLEWLVLLKLIAALGSAILAIATITYLLTRLLRLWRATPTSLFLRLCRAHHLRWTERWLLWRVAAHLSPHEPARMFIEPVSLEDATALPAFFGSIPRLLDLRARLFDGAEDLPDDLTLPAPLTAAEPLPAQPAPHRPTEPSVGPLDEAALRQLLTPRAGLPALVWPAALEGGSQGAHTP